MGLLARRSRIARKRGVVTPQTSGYIGEFLTYVLEPLLPQILDKGIKVITNAGGLDPIGLKQLIEKYCLENGIQGVTVAAVWGDDLLPQIDSISRQHQHSSSSSPLLKGFDPLNGNTPESFSTDNLLSLNAYLGAEPIVHALAQGANIIVTGRVVDSALILGPLAYSYNWDLSPNTTTSPYLDLIASASLAGHILECGAQCTGGNFTDWKDGAFSPYGGWSNMGYPIVEFPSSPSSSSGDFIITKPDKTGGVVNKFSIAEQILYEVLDPQSYILPDIILDLTHVTLTDLGINRVKVQGAKGRPPTEWIKCTAIKQDGYKIESALLIPGHEARKKAIVLGEALIQRANMILKKMRVQGIQEYRIETPGAEEMFGYAPPPPSPHE
jgi:hypothetical protein